MDKFIECSALTPSDVCGEGGGGAGYLVGGVGKGDFFLFSVVIIAFVCCYALGRFGQTWKKFDYFIVIFLRLGSHYLLTISTL